MLKENIENIGCNLKNISFDFLNKLSSQANVNTFKKLSVVWNETLLEYLKRNI